MVEALLVVHTEHVRITPTILSFAGVEISSKLVQLRSHVCCLATHCFTLSRVMYELTLYL
jgi:hypothetical protein